MSLTTRLMLSRDQGGSVSYGVRPDFSYSYARILTPSTVWTIDIPQIEEPNIPWQAFIGYSNEDSPCAVWVAKTNRNQSTVVPDLPSTITTTVNSWLNPASVILIPGEKISFISTNTAAVVNMVLFLGNVGN